MILAIDLSLVTAALNDAIFEQFAAQSYARGISDGANPYVVLRVARDLGRRDSTMSATDSLDR
jgi:hypothetical protein